MDCIAGSIKNILRKKMRSVLTITGISIGVLSVVIISIIGDIGKTTLNSELNSMGISGICIRVANENGTVKLGEDELAVIQANSNVSAATPFMTSVTNINVRAKSSQSIVWGVDSNADEIVSLELLHGRLINKNDVNNNARVCIVDESFAQASYKRSNIVGKTISLNIDKRIETFTIVGVVKSGGNLLQGLIGDMVPSFIYAPFSTLSTLSHEKGFSQIIAKINSDVDDNIATASIVRELTSNLSEGGSVKIENLNQQKDKLNGIMDAVTLVLSIIGGISLLVAGLSIMTVMLVTVNERTREIGIKKSIGAKKSTILFEFLTESLLLSLTGSIIGAVLGVGFGIIGTLLLGIPFTVNFTAILLCIGFCIGIGILFGVYPAIKAAKLKPVDALRFE